MKPAITHSEITAGYIDNEIIAAAQIQAQKDLGQFSLEMPTDSEGDSPYTVFFNNLRPVIAYLIEKNTQKLAQVIYRIDLNESKVAEALDNLSEDNPVDALTALIVEREVVKVLLRRKYSE